MSYQNVKSFFEKFNLGDRVVVREHIGDTVEHAAQAVGCKPEQIAKTMSLIQKENPVLICMAGDAKVDNAKYKAYFQQKAVMIPSDQVEQIIGYAPGAVCPFAINEGIKVYLDISLKRFSTVYISGGSLNSTVTLTIEELEKYAASIDWIDVCKGWHGNEQ